MEWRHTVWPEGRLVYTAVAKVANTSIKTALLASYRAEYRGKEHALAVHQEWMPYLSVRKGHIPLRYRDYLHFTFVRDPFDRLVSFWAQKIEPGTGVTPRLQRLGFVPHLSFRETALRVCDVPDDRADPHFRSQTFVLLDEGKLLPHFVGRLETIDRDWEVLRRLVNVHAPKPLRSLPHRTVSEHKAAHLYYDEDLASRVARRYEQDFAVLGYSTSLAAPAQSEVQV